MKKKLTQKGGRAKVERTGCYCFAAERVGTCLFRRLAKLSALALRHDGSSINAVQGNK